MCVCVCVCVCCMRVCFCLRFTWSQTPNRIAVRSLKTRVLIHCAGACPTGCPFGERRMLWISQLAKMTFSNRAVLFHYIISFAIGTQFRVQISRKTLRVIWRHKRQLEVSCSISMRCFLGSYLCAIKLCVQYLIFRCCACFSHSYHLLVCEGISCVWPSRGLTTPT